MAVILSATLEEISEKGYTALTIESVAERAGVNKTTVYRRWPTKAELTLAALSQEGDLLFADPDTGDVVEDFLVVTRRLAEILTSRRGRALYLVVIQEVVAGGALSLPSVNQRAAYAIVERAVARGDLPIGTDAEMIVSALFGAVIQRALLEPKAVTEDFFRRLVTFTMLGVGAEPPVFRASARRRKRAASH